MPATVGSRAIGNRSVDLDPRSVAIAIVAVLGAAAVLGLVRSLPRTATATVLSVLLVLALDPLVDAVQNRLHLRRGTSVGVVVCAATVVAISITVLLIPPTVRQARQLGADAPRVVSQLADLPIVGDDLVRAGVPERLQAAIEDLPDQLSAGTVVRVGRSVADAVATAILTMLLTVGLLLDGTRLVAVARRLIPARHQERADRIGAVSYRVIGRYAVGSLVVAGSTGVVVLVAGLVVGVPLTPMAALWAALWDLVPQVGIVRVQ